MKKVLLLLLLSLGTLLPIEVLADPPTPPIPIRVETNGQNRPKSPIPDFIDGCIYGATLYFFNINDNLHVTVISELGDEWSGIATPSIPNVNVPFSAGIEYTIIVITASSVYQGNITL